MNIKLAAISIFTVCWYWSSSINAVATQQLVGRFVDVMPISLALILTSSQLLVGSILSIIIIFGMVKLGFVDESMFANYQNQSWFSQSDVIIGILHYVGCVCTNIGFAYGSASLVQVIKLLEPIETLILTVLVHIIRSRGKIDCSTMGEVVSLRQVFGTLVIIGGTSMLLGQNSMDLNSWSIVAALASGFCMSCRNVLKKSAAAVGKKLLPKTTESPTNYTACIDVFMKGMISFSTITILAAISAIVSMLPIMAIGSISPQIVSSFFQNPDQALKKAVFFHCFYNIASITVLSLTSALLHSLLNVGKRIVNVLAVAVVFGVPLSISGKVGLIFAATGTIIYNSRAFSQLMQMRFRSSHLALSLLILFICTIQMGTKNLSELKPSRVSVKGLSSIEIVPHDLLATMAGAGLCEKTIVLGSQVEVTTISDLGYNSNVTGRDDTVCVQKGNFVGAAFYMGSVVRTSDFSALEDFLEDSPDISYHIVERKEVYMDGQYLPANEENNARRKKDGNKGNFVWQYGATNLVNPYTTRFVKDKNFKTSAYILASANLFLMMSKDPENEKRLGSTAQSFADRAAKFDLPSIVLGIGAQVEFEAVEDITTVNMDGYDGYKNFLFEFGSRQKSKAIAVRGDVTERICENSGFTHCLSMGCPSLTISRNMNLGGILEDKWNKVLEKLKKGGKKSKSLKVALALPALQITNEDYGPAVDLLMSIFTQHDCYFILQSNYDRGQLRRYTKGIINESKILVFDDHVEPWFDFMKTVDFAVSYRIHGAMAAISNEVPAVVIPTDFRILELVNAMKLPTLSMEKTKMKNYTSIIDILNDISVDFTDFEQNRRDKLKQYKRILGEAGLDIDPALNAILTQ